MMPPKVSIHDLLIQRYETEADKKAPQKRRNLEGWSPLGCPQVGQIPDPPPNLPIPKAQETARGLTSKIRAERSECATSTCSKNNFLTKT